MSETVAFCGSGGLDSITIARWLYERGVEVVCITGDLAQPDEDDFDDIRARMMAAGCTDFVRLDLQDSIARAGMMAVQAQACLAGRYWNTTGIARHVLVRAALDEMHFRGIGTLSHGCTGRGNDQVRFQRIAKTCAPDCAIYAPWRDPEFVRMFPGRREMVS